MPADKPSKREKTVLFKDMLLMCTMQMDLLTKQKAWFSHIV